MCLIPRFFVELLETLTPSQSPQRMTVKKLAADVPNSAQELELFKPQPSWGLL